MRNPLVDNLPGLRPLSTMLLCPLEEPMAKTRTPGITVLADGRRFIDKRYLGVRIGLRVGAVTRSKPRNDSTSKSLECNGTSTKGACAPDLYRLRCALSRAVPR